MNSQQSAAVTITQIYYLIRINYFNFITKQMIFIFFSGIYPISIMLTQEKTKIIIFICCQFYSYKMLHFDPLQYGNCTIYFSKSIISILNIN